MLFILFTPPPSNVLMKQQNRPYCNVVTTEELNDCLMQQYNYRRPIISASSTG